MFSLNREDCCRGLTCITMKLQSRILSFTFFLYMLQISPSIGGNLNSDRQALLDFAAAVPHARRVNWNLAAPICTSWVGITCNSNKTRVIAIHLPGVGLSGSIPPNSIAQLDALKILSLRSNYLSGSLPPDVSSIPSLEYLNLQHNSFSGSLPVHLSPQLGVLDLSFNSFTGSFPPSIKNLSRLAVLNLEYNSLSGALPDLTLPRLGLLNLSYNKLNGSIPFSLRSFPYSSFAGNSMLCGSPLKNCSIDIIVSSSPSPSPAHLLPKAESKKLGPGSIVAIAIGASAVMSLIVLMITVLCLKRRNNSSVGVLKGKGADGGKGVEPNKDFGSGVQEAEKNRLFFFEGCSYSFDLEDLLKASAEVLGKGSYGTAYRAAMEDGTTVVVKRLKEVVAGKKEFEQQMEVLGRFQHPNVAPVRAYYYSKDEKLLVYNYMPTGSLCSLLHGNKNEEGRSPLDWDTRVKISLGTAKGIAQIHSWGGGNGNGPKTLCHGNIKSSNVLLTPDLDGCISDVGLAPLMNFPAPTMSRVTGYRAPEMVETRRASQKSDVYSFGVLLLEMLTGKAPLQYPGGGQDSHVVDLPRWVRSVVREEWTGEVFDVELMRYQNAEEEMVQLLQIALACVSKVPDMRPGMDQVVRMIEEIQSKNRPSSDESDRPSL